MRVSLFPWTRRTKDDLPPADTSASADPAPESWPDSALWQALLQTTEDAVLLANTEGQVLLSNPVATALFGVFAGGTLLARTLSSDLEDLYRTAIRRQKRYRA